VSLSSGQIELLAGDPEAAERELRRGYDELSRLGERYLLSSVAGYLAEAVVGQGRLEEAEALARETAELAAEDDVDAQMLWRLTRARVCALRGEVEEAEALASEAVRLVEPTDDLVNKTNAFSCHAWVLGLAGREHKAGELLQQARAFAVEKGSSVMVARVDELATELAQLPPPKKPDPVKAPDPV
jgi:Flp pilus assembly protein TadD